MKKILLHTTIFFLLVTSLYAQKENNIWVFPTYYGLDFNGPAPTAITSKVPWIANYAVASVCDASGRLLFYTNTDTIWDRNGYPIPICTTSAWSAGYTATDSRSYISFNAPQGALILPVLNNPNRYYVFIMSGSSAIIAGSGAWDYRLNYSVMDMTLNGGLGDIVPGMAHIPVDSNLGCAMVAVAGNDCNLWLLVHERNVTKVKAYQITTAGISDTPVISNAGTFASFGSYGNGEMAISPNRKKLAIVNVNTNFLPPLGTELCDFDPATGIVSNAIDLDSLSLDESACFSPDNTKLYVSQYGPVYYNGALIQYDITLPTPTAIIASQIPVTDTFEICSPGCGATGEIRAGPDGKIYCTANAGSDGETHYIGCINDPNLSGTACNYINNVVYFPPSGIVGGLSQSLGTDFVKPIIHPGDTSFARTDTTFCIPGGSDTMTLHAPEGYFYYLWDDSSKGATRVIKQAGIYTVRSASYCSVRVDTFIVTNTNLSFSIGQDTTFCRPPFPYVLHASVPGAGYLWQDGSTDSVYTVTKSGHYVVTVSKNGCQDSAYRNIAYINVPQHLGVDTAICYEQPISLILQADVPNGADVIWSDGSLGASLTVQDTGSYWVMVHDGPCTFSDSITVSRQACDCAFNMPTVFSPNSDGRNDLFRPIIQPGCPVANFLMTVYNRWGQEIWKGYTPTDGWDGTFNNVPQEIGDYVYIVKFTGGTKNIKYFKKGDVTLVR